MAGQWHFMPKTNAWSKLQRSVSRSSRGSTPEIVLPASFLRLNDLVYEVCKPPNGKRSSVEIVFFHGLQREHTDNPHIDTWLSREKTGTTLWLTWLLEAHADARILTVSYTGSADTSETRQRADMFVTCENFIDCLILDRRVAIGLSGCPVILVGHGLGGLVMKEILVEANSKLAVYSDRQGKVAFEKFLKHVKAVFFYSTPHYGSQLPDTTRGLPKAPLFLNMTPLDTDAQRRQEAFRRLRHMYGWSSVGIGENRIVDLDNYKNVIVEEASARCDTDQFYTADADHFDVCRPDSRISRSFTFLTDVIESVVEEDRCLSQSLLEEILDGLSEHPRLKGEDARRIADLAIGGWACRSHQRWSWNEVGFQVLYSTPRISINVASSLPSEFKQLQAEAVSSPSAQGTTQGTEEKQYKFISKSNSGSEGNQFFDAVEEPWFLSGEGTDPRIKCSWLALLEDTTFTNMKIELREIQPRNVYDNFPINAIRPIASADRKSLLTLMCLFGVHWKDKGKNRELSGTGDFCEISVSKIPHFGEVFTYHDVHRRNAADHFNYNPSRKYYLCSEKARLAMFHCFDLGFATFRTHNDSELHKSLADSLPSRMDCVERVVAFYRGSQEWCPGLSESITCWADASMAKVVYEKENKFKSMFSAVSARSLTTGTPHFVAMLLGGEVDHLYSSRAQISSVGEVTKWAKEYIDYAPVAAQVKECLKWAATWSSPSDKNNIVSPDIPWTRSLHCLGGIHQLDTHLENHLLEGFEEDDRKDIKCAISNEQIRHGSILYQDACDAAKSYGTNSVFGSSCWIHELDRVGADNYVKIVHHLKDKLQSIVGHDHRDRDNFRLARMITINRLMRGSLWVVHNGNAPDQYVRVSECSLSSSWLLENPIVYIT